MFRVSLTPDPPGHHVDLPPLQLISEDTTSQKPSPEMDPHQWCQSLSTTFRISSKAHHTVWHDLFFIKLCWRALPPSIPHLSGPVKFIPLLTLESMLRTTACAFTDHNLATTAAKPGWYCPGKASSNTVTFPAREQRTSNDRPRAGSEISRARREQQSGRLLHTSHALWEFTQAKSTWKSYMTNSGLWINFFG